MEKKPITALFIACKGLDQYDFAFLEERPERKVAIVPTKYLDNLSEDLKDHFDKIYDIPTTYQTRNPYPIYDFHALKKIVTQEIKLQGASENVFLITAGEPNMAIIAKLREECRLPGPYSKVIAPMLQKNTMKALLQEKGLRTPKWVNFEKKPYSTDPKAYFQHLKDMLGTPFIIKPVGNYGTVDIKKIYNFQDFTNYNTLVKPTDSNYTIEQFIYGNLYHFDSIVQNKKIVFSACSEYVSSGLSFVEGTLNHGSIPLPTEYPHYSKLSEFNTKVLEAFGMIDGSFHVEMFVNPEGEVVFLEINPRTPGSLVVPSYEKTFGINMLNIGYLVQIGEKVSINASRQNNCFWSFFPMRAGKVLKLHTPGLKSDYSLEWHINEGDILSSAEAISHKAATLTSCNKDFDVLYQDFLKIRDFNAIDVEPLSDNLAPVTNKKG